MTGAGLVDSLFGGGWMEWGGPAGLVPALVLVALASIATVFVFYQAAPSQPRWRRGLTATLRGLAVLLLGFLLFQPVLVRPVLERSQQAVAILRDDSMSMAVRDEQGRTRAERVTEALRSNEGTFDGPLRTRFHVFEYGFGAGPRPITERAQLRHEGRESAIASSIQRVAEGLGNVELAAVVVLSDGAAQPAATTDEEGALAALDVPVYTVGVHEATWRDLALGEVALSRSFADGAPARVTAQFTATGFDGQSVVIDVLRNGVLQASETRVIRGDDVEQQVQIDVVPRERDWQDYQVRLRLADLPEGTDSPEMVRENNSAEVLLDHREKPRRILYFAGRPNWQYKFVRHALAGDPELKLSGLLRVSGAEKNFVFQGRDSSLGNPLFEGVKEESELPRYDEAVFIRMGLGEGELAEGYPTEAEALYPFHLIIWGDIEADFFAPAHLRLTRDAIAERGASFLLLGGTRTLGGGHAGSLIESMLPAMPRSLATTGESAAQVSPSPEGFLTGIWALRPERGASESAWAELPPLPAVDSLDGIRIGASVLAEAAPSSGGEPYPFLIQHAYGRGRSAVLATGETWPWHMQTGDDNADHERLWRQLVRALVSTVPEPIALEPESAPRVAGDETLLTWTVRNNRFEPVEGATLTARVVDASGEQGVPLLERLDRPGTYEGRFTPATSGFHRVALTGGDAAGIALPPVETGMLVAPDTREFREARANPGLLQEIAAVTGGRYFDLEALDQVAPAILSAEREHATVKREPLWHHPVFYLLLAALLGTEWTLRRRWGQP